MSARLFDGEIVDRARLEPERCGSRFLFDRVKKLGSDTGRAGERDGAFYPAKRLAYRTVSVSPPRQGRRARSERQIRASGCGASRIIGSHEGLHEAGVRKASKE